MYRTPLDHLVAMSYHLGPVQKREERSIIAFNPSKRKVMMISLERGTGDIEGGGGGGGDVS